MPPRAPRKINLGSGKDFRPEYLNIDINDYWSPDVIANVSDDFPRADGGTYPTQRFGDIVIAPGAFDEIMSNDVLEHVPDLVATMTSCLRVLRIGGVFNISVPYDLSYGAWQDPTHLRAFNERSWLYYTDWFWYLGWTEARFVLRKLEYKASELGHSMLNGGSTQEIVVRTPRGIDSMSVTLEKIPLSDKDRVALASFTDGRKRNQALSQARA
jgi:SAM-dependent methyltransferase